MESEPGLLRCPHPLHVTKLYYGGLYSPTKLDLSSEYSVHDVHVIHRFLRRTLPEELVQLILGYLDQSGWWALITCKRPHITAKPPWMLRTMERRTMERRAIMGRLASNLFRKIFRQRKSPIPALAQDGAEVAHEHNRIKLRTAPVSRRLFSSDTSLPLLKSRCPKSSLPVRMVILELQARLQTPIGVTAVRRPRADRARDPRMLIVLYKTAYRELNWPSDSFRPAPTTNGLRRSSLHGLSMDQEGKFNAFWSWSYEDMESREWMCMFSDGDAFEFWVEASGALVREVKAKVHLLLGV